MSDLNLSLKIQALIGGLQEVGQLAAEIQGVADAGEQMNSGGKNGAAGLDAVRAGASASQGPVADLADGLGEVGEAASAAGESAQGGADGMGALADQAGAVQQPVADLADSLGQAGEAASAAGESAQGGADGMGALADQAGAVQQPVADLADSLGQAGEAASGAGDAAKDGADGMEALSGQAQDLPVPVNAANSWLKSLASMFGKVEDSATDGADGVKAVNEEANALPKPVNTANSWLKNLAETLFKVDDAGKAGAAGVKGAGNAAEGAVSPMQAIKGELSELIGLFAALAVAYGIKESADYAARTEVLGTTLNVVSKNAGYAAADIRVFEADVKKMGITTQGAREAMIGMIQSGMEIGPAAAGEVAQVARLARAAQDLAVVTGESSSETLTHLITNISQLDTVGLRYMGLTVDVQAAQDRFALSLGKTTDQLTQQQKTQAVANAALAEASKLQGAYEASMQNVGKQLQSITRYQEELANDIGSKFLPAYFELVKAATDFLKVADETVKSSDKSGQGAKALADGSKVFFTGLGDLFNAVLTVGAEVAPTLEVVLGMLLELGGEVAHGIGAILQLGDEVDATGKRSSALGVAIKDTVIIPIGILIAGLRDGFSIIGAIIAGLAGASIDFAGLVLEGWGRIVKLFNKDLGESILAASKQMRDAGQSMTGFADDVVVKFARGESALGQFNARLTESKERTEALARASTYGDIEEQIRKLTEAKRKATMTDVELTASAAAVAEKIKWLGLETDSATGKAKLSEEQMRKLSAALLSVTKDGVAQFGEAVNDLGFKLVKLGGTQYLVPLSKDFEKLSGDVLKLADNASATSVQFQQAFSKGLGAAKTVTDIAAISTALKNASASGKELGDTTGQVVGQFEKVFAAALKAAESKNDIALLTAQVKDLGEKGLISGQIVAKALADIKEKSTGAIAETALLARQLTELGRAEVDISKARLNVAQADYQVGHARLDVWKAQNKYAQDGSDLSREELRLAEMNLELAQAKAAEARLAYAEAQQSGKVLIAQQEQILAIKRLERDLDNQSLILAKDAADKKLAGETAAYEKVKQQSEAQQVLTNKIEENVFKQRLAVEQAQAIADQTRQAASSASGLASSTGTASNNLTTAAGGATALNNGLMSAGAAAQTLSTNLAGATAEQTKLAAAIGATAAAQQRLAAAKGETTGVSVIGDGGIEARNAAVKAGSASSGTLGQPYERSAEENRLLNFLSGDGRLGEQDRAYIEATFEAAKNNLAIAQQNSGAFSNEGFNSAMTRYNEARRALEAIGGSTGGGSAGMAGYTTLSQQLLGRVASNAGSGSVSMSGSAMQSAMTAAAPAKVVQVNFADSSGKTVAATVPDGADSDLLDMLRRAQGVAN